MSSQCSGLEFHTPAPPYIKEEKKKKINAPTFLFTFNFYSMTEQPDYLRMILTARVYDIIQETPLQEALNLNSKLGSRIYLKREDLQPVFSFKIRGAYNRMAHLTAEEKKRGVIACSAGKRKKNNNMHTFSLKHNPSFLR